MNTTKFEFKQKELTRGHEFFRKYNPQGFMLQNTLSFYCRYSSIRGRYYKYFLQAFNALNKSTILKVETGHDMKSTMFKFEKIYRV